MKMRAAIIASLVVGMTLALPHQPRAPTCGYESCPKAQPGKLNVHLVPHTHDDVGWLKTVDQYYYGSKNNIQNAGVQYILDSVVNVLLRDPAKKFIYVETSFFWMWWVEQTPELQEQVKGLVNSGQLEFIGGAWAMNDEATTHYQTTIDQFTYGLGKLNETFGKCGQPKVGWQIDPFGHSREQASLMAQYGFDGLFFARLDYQDKDKRVREKTMETIWETSPSLGDSDLFTHVLNNHYSTPGGFCWDDYCGDDPIIDNPSIPDYNVPDRVDSFINAMRTQSQRFRSNNILVVFGDDFQYKSAHKNYKNIDKLISSSDIFGHGLYHEYASPPGFCFDIVCTDEPFIDNPNSEDYNVPSKVDDFLAYVNTQAEGDGADMFTSILYNWYFAPPGFCFDIECGDEPIIDNPKSFEYNVPRRVNEFIKFVTKQATAFDTNNVIIAMGGDFNYQNAQSQFKNIDKLIRYVNERQSNGSDVNVFYSTPSCYLKSVNEAEMSWSTKQDDFFPYSSDPNSYWTGYFTSRPTLKYFERQSNTLLQTGKQLASVTKVDNGNLEPLQAAMGIMQHHDAITGTEKQAVAEDYARLLHKAVVGAEQVVFSALNTLLGNGKNVPPLALDSCRLRNISQCALTAEKESFLVTIYNPLSRSVDYYVRLPVSDATYTVQSPDGTKILTQTLPVPDQLTRLPGRVAQTAQELVFTASQLPPLGYRSYLVTRDATRRADATSHVWKPTKDQAVTIGDEETKITLDTRTKFLKSISTRAETYDVAQSLQYYIGQDNGRASGAYIFRPTTTAPMQLTDNADTVVIEGEVVHEVHQVFSDWASQIIRHYNDQPVVEFEWLVGPIPVDDRLGREIISKFTTSIPTNGTFYTDTNGRDVIQRKRNFRPTWDWEITEPVAGNYYPIVTHISFANSTSALAIVTDRAQGGSSMVDGSLEVMVHRRLLHDDGFGAGEALNEQQYGQGLVARGRHFVLIGQTNSTVSPREIRLLETRKVLDGLVFLSDATGNTLQNIQSNYRLEYSALTKALPEQVQILTLEPRKDGTLLLRLEHIFNREEDQTTVSVDLTNLLADYEITAARETNLAANKLIEETTRLTWQKETNEIPKYSPKAKIPLALTAVELEPKQIRTFIVDIKAR